MFDSSRGAKEKKISPPEPVAGGPGQILESPESGRPGVARSPATSLTMQCQYQLHQEGSSVRLLGGEVQEAKDIAGVVTSNRQSDSAWDPPLPGDQVLTGQQGAQKLQGRNAFLNGYGC